NDLSYKIIGAAIEVHKVLGGPGLLESVYESALCHELLLQGLQIQTQVPLNVIYKGCKIREPLYLDILVENKIIIEIKATEKEYPIHSVQLLTYLRLTRHELGLLINFGNKQVKNGVERIINDKSPCLRVSVF
ncbi:MAG: GxxExxY protein, partial [Chlamydiales bacterium]|nr:GxxExxY protein [Chlamydiales bacterium]